ncbi:uncharacterized protein LOC109706644 [Ananas comosus]|uniref:RING-type E3 ubiquitin transferase BRCA1 n=1 Tax=Ananas comosus TaxID=4615 RepID=A0A6P5EPF2_ANACO|nr:uncharacterized protein LOC109706644 [Ananas comosus]
MEPDDLEDDDSPHRSKDSAICPVRGMESVIATVSGYHGTERFKLIKLIAQVGANYVGAMSRSTTHLVCWQFEGKKYNIARRIGAHIVSHRWLEDCLKEGKRISEGPYAKKSGKEAGPISWELPIFPDTHQKKRCIVNREWDAFPAFSSSPDCLKEGKVDATRPENGCLKWSDSHLLKELCEWPGGSSLCSSGKKRNLSNVVRNDAGGESARRSRRLMKKTIDDHNKHSLIVSSDELEIVYPKSVNLHTSRSTSSSSSQPVNLATKSDNEERGTQVIEQVEKRFLRKSPIWGDSESSKSLVFDASSPHETNLQNDHCKHSGESSSCDFVVDNDGASEEGGELDESAIMQRQAELSCVICWTDYSSTRGVLACGHRFCYSCILGWADCLASRGKISTCPLCKATFNKISKMDEAGSLDQKIYSQTIPCSSSNIDIFMLAGKENDNFRTWSADSVCYECHNREPEDLLVSCHICQSQWVHSCCLDPPLVPWTCIHCRDLRMLYQRFR